MLQSKLRASGLDSEAFSSDLEQAEREAIMTRFKNKKLRILVGTDGRVRQVQILNATDPDFARATEKQALKAWRFKPATRDGVGLAEIKRI